MNIKAGEAINKSHHEVHYSWSKCNRLVSNHSIQPLINSTTFFSVVLAKSIQSFARIGSDLFIEAQANGLSIRTVNKTSSAFALMLFHCNFFSAYDVDTTSDNEYENKCKISMKSAMGAFRNMKQVAFDNFFTKLLQLFLNLF